MRFVRMARASSKREHDTKGEIMNQFNNFTRFLCLRDPIAGIDRKVPVLDDSLQPYINFDNTVAM